MVCLWNISVNTLHKGDAEDGGDDDDDDDDGDDDNNNNNNNNNNKGIIIIIIIIIIILVISFMQGVYNYIPETNHVTTLYSVAAVPYLHFVLHVMLYRP
jgi:hypothetical protein